MLISCCDSNFVANAAAAPFPGVPPGCVDTRACAGAVSELTRGRKLSRALEIEPGNVEHLLGWLPEDHMYCARLAVNTRGEAIADVLRRQMGNAG